MLRRGQCRIYMRTIVLYCYVLLGGVLAVSRAVGDRLLKQYVVADQKIQVLVLHHSIGFG